MATQEYLTDLRNEFFNLADLVRDCHLAMLLEREHESGGFDLVKVCYPENKGYYAECLAALETVRAEIADFKASYEQPWRK